MEKQVYSLFELNQYVKQVLSLNFEIPIWIDAEVSQLNQSRNHVYLDLIEQDNKEEIVAQARATIWFRTHQLLKRKYGRVFDEILQEGQSVKIKVLVNFHERYGYSLNVQDIDPHYTLGKIAIEREKTLEQLRLDGLIEKNASIPEKQVLQRIAVLSAESAAGYQDFNQSLLQNEYGYYFDVTLYTIALQGKNVNQETLAALKDIDEHGSNYDCVVIIRGGGSRVDLAAFDDKHIARAIANCALPVYTGIGHDIDMSISDVVAHTQFKTPTAVAEYLINHNHRYEEEVYEMAYQLESSVQRLVFDGKLNLRRKGEQLVRWIREGQNQFSIKHHNISHQASVILASAQKGLSHKVNLLKVLNPEEVLKRGYSLTYTKSNEELITSETKPDKGTVIISKLYNANIESTVN